MVDVFLGTHSLLTLLPTKRREGEMVPLLRTPPGFLLWVALEKYRELLV